MSKLENLDRAEGVIKLKKMIDDVKYCFFFNRFKK